MKLTYNDFLVLTELEKNNNKNTQGDLSNITGLSLKSIKSSISFLIDENYIDENYVITKKGLEVLKPYRVKRAIFLAAGFGSRMIPITINTPKPMVKVNGKMIIETLLDAVVEAGIKEIIIITGHLSEQFNLLLKKYPNIKLIYNDKYNEANNISSAYLIKKKFANSYVLESDLILYNKNLIRKYEYRSNYLGRYVSYTDDWCLDTKKGIIVKEKIGGCNCYQMQGIAYFDSNDASQMEKNNTAVYNSPGGKEKYWEQVFFEDYKSHYKIAIRECKEGDIVEVDTFNELKKIDKSYDKEY